jgi:uncharacterized RDD family membrane protein YckC
MPRSSRTQWQYLPLIGPQNLSEQPEPPLTIGKKMIGIKVIRKDGSQASLGRIFWLRNVVNLIIAMFLPVIYYYVIDPLFIFGERQQCLHDLIADTIVVNA